MLDVLLDAGTRPLPAVLFAPPLLLLLLVAMRVSTLRRRLDFHAIQFRKLSRWADDAEDRLSRAEALAGLTGNGNVVPFRRGA